MLSATATASKMLTRSLSTSAQLNKAVNKMTVIGGGLMGSGIAQVSAQAKLNVVLVDQDDSILQKSLKSIEKSVQRVAKKKHADDASAQQKFVSDITSRISTNTNLYEAVQGCDLVVEAIVENVAAKQDLFDQVETAAADDTLIATNTSSLRLADISAKLKRKENFGALHFFNPVPVMKLLEVVRGEHTSDETFNSLIEYGKQVGKVTVKCKDTPGFIVNRLLVPYMFEAISMLERGDASISDIDTAMKLGAGYPMGPFELADYVGLDTLKFIQDGWRKTYPDEPIFRTSKMLDKLVDAGKLGNKSGEGFHKQNK